MDSDEPATELPVDFEDQASSRPGRSGAWAAAALLALLFYVLSPGPVVFVLLQLPEPLYDPAESAIAFVYIPLEFLYDRSPLVASFYDWYFNLFMT